MENTELTLEELASISLVPIRTLRFYIQEGLLPGPDTRGKNATYSNQHLERIEMIKRLKEHFLPLQQIKSLLDNMSEDDIQKILIYREQFKLSMEDNSTFLENRPKSSKVGSSALDYIRSLEQTQHLNQAVGEPKMTLKMPKEQFVFTEAPIQYNDRSSSRPRRESWRKIIFTDGVELHISVAREKQFKAEIQELVDFARNLFE